MRIFETLFPGRAEKLMRLDAMRREAKLQETVLSYLDAVVDPLDALRDDDTGELWTPVGAGQSANAVVPRTEQQLAAIRDECRALAATNPYAICGHENRIGYIVGSGHGYTATSKEAGKEDVAEVQTAIDEWIEANTWQRRQQEIVRRVDRDGECFLRFFGGPEGALKVRFVEPSQVAQPAGNRDDTWGIATDPDDVETVTGYWIDGKLVEAAEIQHRKGNVDCNVKRGLPLFYAIRKNLRRAEKLLLRMSTVAEIQTSIAMIRKHKAGGVTGLDAWAKARADATVTDSTSAKTSYFKRYAPGTILDTREIEYEFPGSGIDGGKYTAILQAELRAIASRLVMPEFMLSSDASNANYSSTMVAEGPAVKAFERWQWEVIADDMAVLDRVLDAAVAAGRISQALREQVRIDVQPPQLTTRNRLQEVQADGMLVDKRIMSVRTAQVRNDLDPEVEEENIRRESEESAARNPFAGLAFGGEPKDQGDEEPPDDGGDKPGKASDGKDAPS